MSAVSPSQAPLITPSSPESPSKPSISLISSPNAPRNDTHAHRSPLLSNSGMKRSISMLDMQNRPDEDSMAPAVTTMGAQTTLNASNQHSSSSLSTSSSTHLINDVKNSELFSDFHYDLKTNSYPVEVSVRDLDVQKSPRNGAPQPEIGSPMESSIGSPQIHSLRDKLLASHDMELSPASSLMHSVASPQSVPVQRVSPALKDSVSPENFPRSILTNKMCDRNVNNAKKDTFVSRVRGLFGKKTTKGSSQKKRVTINTPQQLVHDASSPAPTDLSWKAISDFNQQYPADAKDIPVSDAFTNQPKVNIKHYGQTHKYSPHHMADDTSSEFSRSTLTTASKKRFKEMVQLASDKPDHTVHSGRCYKRIKQGSINIKMPPGKAKVFVFGIGFEVDKSHTLRGTKKGAQHPETFRPSASHGINREGPKVVDSHYHLKKEIDDEDIPHIGEHVRERSPHMSPLHRSSSVLQRQSTMSSISNMIRPISMRNLARLSTPWHHHDANHHTCEVDDRTLHTECAKNLPPEMQRHLRMYCGKKWTYSLRSSLLLYDRFGFLLKGSYVRKKVVDQLSYNFERRRAIQDALNIQLEDDFTCTISRAVSSSNKRYAELLSRIGDMFNTVKDNLLTPKNHLEDQLFIEHDNCYDVEQIKLELTDADLVKHLILVMHFDAPALAFTHKKNIASMKGLNLLSHCIPRIRPYVRVIDANESREVLRYYVDHAPKLSVTLEMNQVMRKQFQSLDKILLEVDHEHFDQQQACKESPRRSPSISGARDSIRGAAPNKRRRGSAAVSEREEHVDVETDSLSNPSSDDDENVLPGDPDDDSSEDSATSFQEIKVDKLKREELRDQSDTMMEWRAIPLMDEYQFETPYGMDSEIVLSQFLFQSNENEFGTKAIPRLPKKYCVTVEQARNINIGHRKTFFNANSKYFCIVSTDSAHQTEKKHTKMVKHSRSLIWREEFPFIVQHMCRSSAVVVEVYERRRFGFESLVGIASFPFGSIKSRNTPYSAYKAQWCPLFKKGVQKGEIMIRLELLWSPKVTLNAHGKEVMVDD